MGRGKTQLIETNGSFSIEKLRINSGN